jgi:hypothetical protein
MSQEINQVTLDVLKGTSRVVDFTKMIKEQEEFVKKAQRLAGQKPSKIEAAYIDEQAHKLLELQQIVLRWGIEAFGNEEDYYQTGYRWDNFEENYKVTVIVEKI